MKERVFRVYRLDMYLDENNSWVENQRFLLGKVRVPMNEDGSVDDASVLTAVKAFKCRDFNDCEVQILNTTDRRRVYVEDLYGDGMWLEIGSVKGRVPCYGLEVCGGAVA